VSDPANQGDAIHAATDVRSLSPSRQRFLRYWSLNMTLVRQAGWAWPVGFTYSGDEEQRMAALAATVPRAARLIWLAAAVAVFMLGAAGAMMMTLGTALTFLWPNASEIPELGFFTAMALAIVLAVGIGMPLSVAWGGAIADRIVPLRLDVELVSDTALHAKVTSQFRRMAVFAGLLFVAAAMGWGIVLGRP
jgi:hypothetical protein